MSKTKKSKKRTSRAKSSKLKEDLIDFDSWLWFKIKNNEIRNVQRNEIKIFFQEKGLKDKESKSKFDEILKLY